jgi:hypothetical protein
MSHSSRGLVASAYVAFAAFGAFWGVWGASVPRVQDQAGVSDGELGLALLFVGAGALPAMLLVGRASVVTVVSYLGFLLGPVYVGLWADATDLRGAMIAVAVLAGALFILTPMLLRLSGFAR